MSDGNYNRALLPKNELAAGIRAGKAQMRTKAEQAFMKTMQQFMPDLPDRELQNMHDAFMQFLRQS